MQSVILPLFWNAKTKSLFTLSKLGLIKKYNYWFCSCTDTFVSYFFQLIVLLKPDFKCSNSFALSWVDKVTTGTQSLLYIVYCSLRAIGLSITKYLLDQVRIRLISQLINCILRVIQKLLNDFASTLLLTFSVPSFAVLPAIFILNLNEALLPLSAGKSVVALLAFKNGSSLY